MIKILAYSLVLSISLVTFIVFKPYSFVDNEYSQIICNNGGLFDIGPNFIFVLEDDLDNFNDVKARKLCEYNAIRDYGDYYKSPDTVNYRFRPVYLKESSWADALFLAIAVFLPGALLIETVLKKPTKRIIIIYVVLAGVSIFFLFLKKPATQLFCYRQFAKKVVNFRNSAFKNGVYPIPEEDKYINTLVPQLYQKCLKNEGF